MSWANELSPATILEKNSMLKKHIATVHVEANLSLLEHKIYNVLLINAYPKLKEKGKHTMRYSALCELINYSSGDRQSIKEAIRNIAKIQIEWIGKNSKGKEISWNVYNYLSSAWIHFGSDTFTYGFDQELAEHLYDPEVFAKISLIAQRQFSSKYSLYLYENCARYRKNEKFQGLTPKWEIELFRKFMGVSGKKLYESFAELNRRILKPAIKEINEVSDISLTLTTLREGRRVTGLQFLVEDNPNQAQLQIPGVKDEFNLNDASENPVVKQCIKMGIGDGIAIQWLKAYGEAYLLEKIAMAEQQVRTGKIHTSTGGWLTRAIKHDYQDDALKLQAQKKHQRDTARQERETEIQVSEKAMEKQRSERQRLRDAVASYINDLDHIDSDQFEVDFVRETNLSPFDKEAFHDWVAKRHDLGNPYPAQRVKRLKNTLISAL